MLYGLVVLLVIVAVALFFGQGRGRGWHRWDRRFDPVGLGRDAGAPQRLAPVSSKEHRLVRRVAGLALWRAAWPLTALQVARAARGQWKTNLSVRQRRQLLALLRKSGGRPGRLSARDRRRLRAIITSYDVPQLARRALGQTVARRGFRRLRR